MTNHIYILLFVLIWWGCFLLYPMWYVPNAGSIRIVFASALMVAAVAFGYAFRLLSTSNQLTSPFPKDTLFWWILFTGIFCLHIPFLPLPVITGLDMIDHASVPALVASKIINPLSSKTGFSISFIFTPCVLLLTALFCFIPKLRQSANNKMIQISKYLCNKLWLVYTVLFMVTIGCCGLVYLKQIPDRFGDIETIFRYQPISKIILIPAYVVFGIQEWVGRVIQLIGFFAGAYFIYQTTLMFATKEAARLTAIIYLLLPPVFHYGNTHLIEGGSLFLVTASFFYWIRYFEKHNQQDLMLGSFWATMGCLYKHTNVIMIPAFAVLFVWDFLRQRTQKPYKQYGYEILANSIPAITFFIYMKLSSFSSDTPSQLAMPDLQRVSENILAIPQGITFTMFGLFIAGFLFVLFLKRQFLPYMIAWVIPHFLLTVMSEAFPNVRQALPYYLALIIAGVLFLDFSIIHQKLKKYIYYGLIPCSLIWVCLFMAREHQPLVWGRAMGDRSYINFSNWDDTYVPYHIIIPDLMKRTDPDEKIFAPMGSDTSQFYIAKNQWSNHQYTRSIFTDDGMKVFSDLNRLKLECMNKKYDWLLLPRGKWLLQYEGQQTVETLFTNPPTWLRFEHTYIYGDVEVGLWKVMHQ